VSGRIRIRSLLAWFAENARDLPWRRTTDPYAIWISEVMLQQTQVQTVIPYWERWMTRVPDVRTLARTKFETILKLWEGLGYYSRAKNLHQAAQIIMDQHHGSFPDGYEAVLALPGIGRYTAGAICSIAFDQPTPILDGNVVRVLTRLYGISDNVRSQRTKARLWRKAEQLIQTAARSRAVPGRRCSMFNQALMELGATICTPKQPQCPTCPVHLFCVARRTGLTDRLPNLGQRAASTPRRFAAFIVCHGKHVLVRQRPGGTVNAHLWEFPNLEVTGEPASVEELACQCLGWRPESLKQLCVIRHAITRYRIRLDAYQAVGNKARKVPLVAGRWCTPRELEKLAFPSAHRGIIRALRAG
jgi:A/G-specific adenine glycosylase